MALALFDLDNTLLNGDSDHAWGLYLGELGVVDADEQKLKQDYFYQQYVDGCLDIFEFLEFQLAVLADNPMHKLLEWRTAYIDEVIRPMIESGKTELLEQHRENNDTLVIITATNDFITRPIANLLGVETLIATTAELLNDRYSGKVAGTPCFQDGKVERLNDWLQGSSETLEGSWFYSDSINDLPLLELTDNPVAVAPDDSLRAHALQFHWPIID